MIRINFCVAGLVVNFMVLCCPKTNKKKALLIIKLISIQRILGKVNPINTRVEIWSIDHRVRFRLA